MKQGLLLIALIISFLTIQAQDSTAVSSPKIITKIETGESVKLNDITITFKKVTEDSRCPKGVECFTAGQATILIQIETPEGSNEQKLIFGTNHITPENNKEIIASQDRRIIAYNLEPYPLIDTNLATVKYYLQVMIE
ncbi:hypothetical protein ACE939_12280 [Aquimarina sp. W85]|uniref:hypothetical protein n=1 Tax=Aquimarina rhodophyticola TaxID=3342246 RepID=UPI00366C55A0